MEEIVYNGYFTLQWHITHRCNLRCTHCYQEDYSAFESRGQLKKILEQFQRLLVEHKFKGHINITGGEPLSHPELFWLLSEAQKRGITTAVLTNGTLIGREEAKKLKRCGVMYVQVSLDGTKAVHDKIRGEGSFDSAVRGIRELLMQGIDTTVSFTAQRGNYRELPRLARYCRELGVDKLWFDRVVISAKEDKNGMALSAEEYERLCKTAARLNKRQMLSCARALQFIPCRQKDIYRCTAGNRLLAVLADGSVMPCRRLPKAAGNINDSDLPSIYNTSPVLIEIRNAGLPRGCEGCEYSKDCFGGAKCIAYAKAGRCDIADPDCPLKQE